MMEIGDRQKKQLGLLPGEYLALAVDVMWGRVEGYLQGDQAF